MTECEAYILKCILHKLMFKITGYPKKYYDCFEINCEYFWHRERERLVRLMCMQGIIFGKAEVEISQEIHGNS